MTENHTSAPRLGQVRAARIAFYGGIALFLFGALVLGGALKMYDRFWWWDDMLHGISGIVLVAVGLVIVARQRPHTALHPLFVALFCFCFALAIGLLWEVCEFTSDLTLHTALQQWDMPPQAIVMGASYQGMGLRDTMSDLINSTAGAVVMTSVVFATYRRKGIALLRVVERVLPERRH